MAKQLSAAEDCEEKHKLTTKVFQDFVVNVLERELSNSAESRSLGSVSTLNLNNIIKSILCS
jgi:hypothetical protein